MKPIQLISMAAIAALLMPAARAADGTPQPLVFGAAQVSDIYRVLLNRDALLLESINDVIQQKNVQDGEVLITAGSVQECTYHFVYSTAMKPKDVFKTVKGPYEILEGGGIIAAGEPHIHIALSTGGASVVGGHLEKGCRVLYLAELTIVKYTAPPLVRKENQYGVRILEGKQ